MFLVVFFFIISYPNWLIKNPYFLSNCRLRLQQHVIIIFFILNEYLAANPAS
jgi:hypothetical protein